jgi:hypothetical protein
MSTPSPLSLDHLDPVSSYAPRRARSQTPDTPGEPEHPPGIETAHDARILDEIEASLRAMITSSHGGDEVERLSDVSRAAAERIAQQQQEMQDVDEAADEDRPAHADEPQAEQSDPHQFAADVATVRAAFRDPRTPPWLLSRSLDPEPIPEPVDEHWPQPRKRSRGRSKANSIFLRFGLAATGAAIVAAITIKDLPSFVMEKIRGPIVELSTNASAVFNEGRASTLQARIDAAQKQQDASPAPSMRYAVANADPQAKAVPVKTEAIGRAPERRETVMTPWPAPDVVKRPEPAGWQSPPAREPVQPQARESVSPQAPVPDAASTTPAPSRNLSEEEIAMLRKMGDDYISSGDFVGARTVLERAAEAGDSSAAFAIASTYDPVVLARFKVRGLEPDIVKASFWYERARALGSSEAPHRLQAMMAARSN